MKQAPSSPAAESPAWGRRLLAAGLAAALVTAILILFLPALDFTFTSYDDDQQILDNPFIKHLSQENVSWMLTHFCIDSYYPVRLLSFAVDYHFWGVNPRGYHLTNAAIHAANVLLLFWLLLRLGRGASLEPAAEAAGGAAGKYPAASAACSGAAGLGARGAEAAGPRAAMLWRLFAAALAAALLAVHPVVVEPVVWVPGREELLMTCFALLALHARVSARRAATAGAARGRVAGWHLLTALACAGALTCNIAGVTVPLLVLAYDLTAAGVRRVGPLVTGNWFLWPLAAGAIVLKQIGDPLVRRADVAPMPLAQHIATVLDCYRLNLGTLLAPRDLSLLYSRASPASLLSFGPLAGAALGLLTLAALWLLRRHKTSLFGLLGFLLALGPTAQVLPHHTLRADRYLYLPLVGLAVTVAAVLWPRRSWRRVLFGALGLGAVAALAVQSSRHLPVWQDNLTLFAYCLRWDPDDARARNNLAIALFDRGRIREAQDEFREALRLKPDLHMAHNGLGLTFLKQGNTAEAVRCFEAAIRLKPLYAAPYSNLAAAMIKQGNLAAALSHYETAMQLDPTQASYHHNSGIVLSRLGDNPRAIQRFQEAIRLAPDLAISHAALGLALLREQRVGQAIPSLQEALRLNPDQAKAHANLATALALEGRFGLALQQGDEALRRDPRLADQMSRLARLLAASPDERLRNGPAAVQFAERACRAAKQPDPTMLDTLAAAYAEAGRFDDAVAAAQRAIDLAQALGRTDLANEIRGRQVSYQGRKPLRQAQDARAVLPPLGPAP
jgi:tetratricopeptide (TPR) repeat protein